MNPKKTYHVSPDGNIVEASQFARLKAGWRVATQADWDAAAKVEAERKKAEKPAPRGPLAK